MNTNDSDKNKGIYQKFRVERTDGSSAPGGKHEKCRYFVLDLDHDPHAPAALRTYAHRCVTEYPALAHELLDLVHLLEQSEDGADLDELDYCHCHPDTQSESMDDPRECGNCGRLFPDHGRR